MHIPVGDWSGPLPSVKFPARRHKVPRINSALTPSDHIIQESCDLGSRQCRPIPVSSLQADIFFVIVAAGRVISIHIHTQP